MSEHEQPEIHERQEITDALAVLRRGAPEALDELLPLVYSELRRIAHRQLAAEPTGHTLSTTALVHEAYLRFAREDRAEWSNRPQFFALAARIMRRVLVDYARRHWAQRRGGVGQQWIPLEEADDAGPLRSQVARTISSRSTRRSNASQPWMNGSAASSSVVSSAGSLRRRRPRR